MTGSPQAPSAGFSRQRRLLTKAAYAAVFANPRKIAKGCFSAVYAPSHDGLARLGLAISRRQAPTAVERNRLKRLVRESFRQHASCLLPFDVVVMIRSPTRTVSNAALRADLECLWADLRKGSDRTPSRPRA